METAKDVFIRFAANAKAVCDWLDVSAFHRAIAKQPAVSSVANEKTNGRAHVYFRRAPDFSCHLGAAVCKKRSRSSGSEMRRADRSIRGMTKRTGADLFTLQLSFGRIALKPYSPATAPYSHRVYTL